MDANFYWLQTCDKTALIYCYHSSPFMLKLCHEHMLSFINYTSKQTHFIVPLNENDGDWSHGYGL